MLKWPMWQNRCLILVTWSNTVLTSLWWPEASSDMGSNSKQPLGDWQGSERISKINLAMKSWAELKVQKFGEQQPTFIPRMTRAARVTRSYITENMSQRKHWASDEVNPQPSKSWLESLDTADLPSASDTAESFSRNRSCSENIHTHSSSIILQLLITSHLPHTQP